jgi:hypothetical protein
MTPCIDEQRDAECASPPAVLLEDQIPALLGETPRVKIRPSRRYNPNIRGIYRRLKEQGKPDKVARTAATRKLLLLAHAIYESGESFRAPAENGQGLPKELPSCSAAPSSP